VLTVSSSTGSAVARAIHSVPCPRRPLTVKLNR
jgi:hypothetical protein